MKTINSFSGQYSFLSNFYPVKVQYGAYVYPSVEHAFQAAKTLDLAARERIRNAPTAARAKAIGRRVELRPEWDRIRVGVMLYLLHDKFSHPELGQKLLDTGDAELVEGNTWNDTHWGVCRGVGLNMLGKLLMQVREEIRL